MTASASPLTDRPPRWREAMLGALVLTLARPSSWAVALAGFLARGGLLWFLVPIVPLPTTASLANEVSPRLRPVVLGEITPDFVLLASSILAAVGVAVVVGGLIGGWADAQLVRAAAADEELGYELHMAPVSRGLAGRAAAVRTVAHLPLLAARVAATPVLIAAVYAELTNPGEVVTPLVVRTLARIPEAVALVVGAWLLGEAAGGLGVRRLVLRGGPWPAAALGGYRDLVRALPSSLATFALTTVSIVAALVPAALAAGLGWSFARLALLGGRSEVEIVATVVLFVAIWVGGLVIGGAAVAWRSHAWTAEWLRRGASRVAAGPGAGHWAVGTIGGSNRDRRGDWSSPGASGTL
jgi:hypothetical protein